MPDEATTEILLTREQLSQVLALARAATREDGVPPLSEQVLLAIRDEAAPDTSAASRHLLLYAGTQLAGYAHLERGEGADAGATAELVVDPRYRRQGLGAALVRALERTLDDAAGLPAGQGRALRIWSHGNLDGARALASRGGFTIVRELWQMRRSLRPDATPLPAVHLPDGFRTRRFVLGQDEEAWLRVNARAFVGHPEQSRMTRHDLEQRIAEPWFDAGGFILVEDLRDTPGPAPVLAASHWNKVAAQEGEVYVVGVDPAYQGLGLGRAVTVLGLAHLREQGLSEAMLYVDADNLAAVATYAHLDFARSAVDIMYSRTVHTPV